ncbi:putative glycosyltransferase [Oceaniovalibus guishaninsula JLT2003]|uniref:Putative glycosyltransferase n=1 Tax=Oceaniovalibus guishaninsula JLT2003 TaxID=1231392 RepID=K2HEB7_9RHOB|nr:glycosyltransferase family A protein [Oceaniovalibus guishaninsula]EKE44877.1 putative glycosyltransferase [Oceaniovalibus guishaninsula JLT2003]
MPASLSLIVTAYNVAPWVDAALHSALAILQPGDELIVVDDGSSDGTAARISTFEHFAKRPPEVAFVKVLLATNTPGGVGPAANIGLSRATKDIVAFLDGDDTLVPDGFKAARSIFEASLAGTAPDDILIADYEEWSDGTGRITRPFDAGIWAEAVAAAPRHRQRIALRMQAVPWRKFYRREFLEARHLRFPEGEFFFEDNPFHWQVCLAARRIAFTSEIVCRHRLDRPGRTMLVRDGALLAFFDHYRRILTLPGMTRVLRADALRWLVVNLRWHPQRLRQTAIADWVAAASRTLRAAPVGHWRTVRDEELRDPILAGLFDALRKGDVGTAERRLMAICAERDATTQQQAIAELERRLSQAERQGAAQVASDPAPCSDDPVRRFSALKGTTALPVPSLIDRPPDPEPPILWVGAHKTGTTFLQACLEASTDALEARGIAYFPREAMRAATIVPLLDRPGPPPEWPTMGMADGRRRVIFDENILGLSQNVLSSFGVYPEGAVRSSELADRLDLRAPRLVLAIRDMTGFIPSLYCEALKAVPFRRFRDFLETPFDLLSWVPLVDALLAAFPQSGLTVYTAEALRGNEAVLCEAVLGLPRSDFVRVDHSERPGFSQEAVNRIAALHAEGRWSRAAQRQIVRSYPKGRDYPAFDPWSDNERDRLRDRFAEDVPLIAARERVTLVDPRRI